MTIAFDHSITQNFNEVIRREWLETNGLGGWSSSTISGAHTRRYHGLLVAATRPPVGRMVMLSKLDFEYLVEMARGQDFQEDLLTPGVFKCRLKAGDKLGVIASTQNPSGRDAFALFAQEKRRRKKLISEMPVVDETTMTLGLAADQFIVQRDNNLKTIIAGYHWFTDWGRDTMIALPGITLATGRFEDAKKNNSRLCTKYQPGTAAESLSGCRRRARV